MQIVQVEIVVKAESHNFFKSFKDKFKIRYSLQLFALNLYNEMKITRWLGNMNFIFLLLKNMFYSFATLIRKMPFSSREGKIHYVPLLCLTPDYFTRQGRASIWEKKSVYLGKSAYLSSLTLSLLARPKPAGPD